MPIRENRGTGVQLSFCFFGRSLIILVIVVTARLSYLFIPV